MNYLKHYCVTFLFWLTLATAVHAHDISGVWRVSGYAHEYGRLDFLVEIKRGSDGIWRAHKLNPSRFVPVGETHFEGRIQIRNKTLRANVQVALPGFHAPEYRSHTFTLEIDNAGRVTEIVLADGTSHPLLGNPGTADDNNVTENASVTDSWTYTPWPADKYILHFAGISDLGYRGERTIAELELQRARDHTKRWESGLLAVIERFQRAKKKEQETRAEVARLTTAYTKATVAKRKIANAEPNSVPQASDNLPSRLRVLYENRDAATTDQKNAEARVLAHSRNENRLDAATLNTQIKAMDQAAARIIRLTGVIARVREEMNLPPETPPEDTRQTDLDAATQSENQARDAMFNTRRSLSRDATELALASGQVKLAHKEIREASKRAETAQHRLAGLNRPAQLKSIEVTTGTNEDKKIIFQAVPSGLEHELAKLREILNEVDGLISEAQVRSDRAEAAFIEKFDEATVKREAMVDLILENSYEMAGAALVAKSSEMGIAFGTGGPIGLAVELVTTPIFQHALYEDGVIFTNYDETGLQRAYRNALNEAAPEDDDPEKACHDLGIELKEGFKNQLEANRRQSVAQFAERRSGANSGTPDLTGTGATGTSTQRISSSYYNYSALTAGNVGVEFLGRGAERLTTSEGLEEAGEALSRRVSQRLGLHAANQIAQFDTAMSGVNNSANFVRDAAKRRAAALQRLAANYPEIADDVARHLPLMDALMTKFSKYLQVMKETTDPEQLKTVARGAEVVKAQIKELQSKMTEKVGAIVNRETAEAMAAGVVDRVGVEVAQQLSGLDETMQGAASSADEIRQAAQARNQALRRLANANTEIAGDVARHITQMDELTRRMVNYQRLMASSVDAEDLATLAKGSEVVRHQMQELQEQMARRVAGVAARDATIETSINMTRALITQKNFIQKLSLEIAPIDNAIAAVASGLTRGATKAGVRGNIKGSAASVIASLVFAVAIDANISRLQEQERDLWMKIFAAEADQSLLFRAWQRASCIRWALLDQRASLRQEYTKIYDHYDPESGFKVLKSEPFNSTDALRVNLIYEPAIEVGMKTKIADVSCPQSTQASCQLTAGALKDVKGPYLQLNVEVSPP